MLNPLRKSMFPWIFALLIASSTPAQQPRGVPKPVTVPVSIRLRSAAPVEMRIVDFLLREDGDVQQEVSRRTPLDSPMTLAILLQDDLVSSVAVDIKNLSTFVRKQPEGSRVMVAYIRSGSLDVRKKFTNELDKAAQSVRAPQSLASAGAFNPYVEIIEGLKRFVSQPMGRRAMVVVSDGIRLPARVSICNARSPKPNAEPWRSIRSSRHRPRAR